MLVEFLMITKEEEHYFKVLGKKHDNVLTFPDKMTPNTLIDIIFDDDMIIVNRRGKTEMYQEFQLGKRLEGTYQNDMGLSLTIQSETLEMQVLEHELSILYDFYIDNSYQSRNKLVIKY